MVRVLCVGGDGCTHKLLKVLKAKRIQDKPVEGHQEQEKELARESCVAVTYCTLQGDGVLCVGGDGCTHKLLKAKRIQDKPVEGQAREEASARRLRRCHLSHLTR